MQPFGSLVVELRLDSLKKELYDDLSAVLVLFWQPDCPACMKMRKVVEETALLLQGKVRFVHVDIEAQPLIAQLMCIDQTPCCLLMRDRDIVDILWGPCETKKLVEETVGLLGSHRSTDRGPSED